MVWLLDCQQSIYIYLSSSWCDSNHHCQHHHSPTDTYSFHHLLLKLPECLQMLCRGLGELLTLITHSPTKKKPKKHAPPCHPPTTSCPHIPQAHPHHCGLCSKCWAYHSITNRKKTYPKIKNSLLLLSAKDISTFIIHFQLNTEQSTLQN